MSGRCLEVVYGSRLEGVIKVSGNYPEGIWKVSVTCLETVKKESGRCLIVHAGQIQGVWNLTKYFL